MLAYKDLLRVDGKEYLNPNMKETKMTQNKNLPITWTEEDIVRLSKALTFTYKNQNNYKEKLDLADRIIGWKFLLEEDFTMEQVLGAMKQFMKANTDMVLPAHVNNILAPEQPKITAGEYYQAQKWQERNNYPSYSLEAVLIRGYEAQQSEDRAPLHDTPIHPSITQSMKKQITVK